MNSIKKIFAAALAASMVLSMAACGNNDEPAPTESKPADNSSKAPVSSEASKDETPKEKGKTTYLDTCGRPKTWNPHEWQNNDESYVFNNCTTSFYEFKANDTKDNFELVCSAAKEFPVDVSAEYAGNETYGVPADAKEGDGYAYKVTLREDLCWTDGTPIKAIDFVESQKRLLDPKMKNYRASDCYDGNVSYANAKNYYYDGQEDSAGKPTKKVTWDEVGLKATGEYELTFILGRPCSNFYFCYNGNINAVRIDLYDSLKEETGDIVKTKYGTSVDTFDSYGPFVLSEYQEDKAQKYTKNDKWFGYTATDFDGWTPDYEAIDAQVVDEHATRLQLFLQGKLDQVGLDAQDMQVYGSSDYLLLSPQSYTTKFSFNTDLEKLKAMETPGVCKTMPYYIEFRKGFSRMVNRKEYCQALTASHIPGFGLFNRLYLSDPENGTVYRDTPRAQQAICAVYGGEDANSVTGYNLEEAKELFQAAYEKAKADGNYHDGDIVELKFTLYQDDEQSQKIINFLQDAMDKATEGTGLEGKTKMVLVADTDYYTKAAQGDFEMIFSTWGGAAMNPYGLTDVYCNDSKRNEYGFTPSKEMLKGTVAGKEYEMSYHDWSQELLDGQWANAPADVRAEVLAVIEEGLLLQYRAIPLYYRMSGLLTSQRLTYECDEYINNVGFGKQYLNMDDAEWNKHIAEQGGKLDY